MKRASEAVHWFVASVCCISPRSRRTDPPTWPRSETHVPTLNKPPGPALWQRAVSSSGRDAAHRATARIVGKSSIFLALLSPGGRIFAFVAIGLHWPTGRLGPRSISRATRVRRHFIQHAQKTCLLTKYSASGVLHNGERIKNDIQQAEQSPQRRLAA